MLASTSVKTRKQEASQTEQLKQDQDYQYANIPRINQQSSVVRVSPEFQLLFMRIGLSAVNGALAHLAVRLCGTCDNPRRSIEALAGGSDQALGEFTPCDTYSHSLLRSQGFGRLQT